MKRIALAAPLLALVLGSIALLTNCGGLQTRSVSAATIAALPAGEALEVDLTRKGTVYEFNDPDTDFSRVSVRTAAGTALFAERLAQSSIPAPGRGWCSGGPMTCATTCLRSAAIRPPATTAVSCASAMARPTCIYLILSGKCGDDMWCSSTTNAWLLYGEALARAGRFEGPQARLALPTSASGPPNDEG